jgi:hypothetical protein
MYLYTYIIYIYYCIRYIIDRYILLLLFYAMHGGMLSYYSVIIFVRLTIHYCIRRMNRLLVSADCGDILDRHPNFIKTVTATISKIMFDTRKIHHYRYFFTAERLYVMWWKKLIYARISLCIKHMSYCHIIFFFMLHNIEFDSNI